MVVPLRRSVRRQSDVWRGGSRREFYVLHECGVWGYTVIGSSVCNSMKNFLSVLVLQLVAPLVVFVWFTITGGLTGESLWERWTGRR